MSLPQEISSYLNLTIQTCDRIYVEANQVDSPLYKVYDIVQVSGKHRTIQEPVEELKAIQKKLISYFEERFELHPCCTSRRGCSAVENANRHIGARHILKVDIKSCYPSITFQHISNAIWGATTSLASTILPEMIHFCVIASKEYQQSIFDYVLPTGAPTSPILCNIALTPLDYQISEHLAKKYNYKYRYSRYLDDIIISTSEPTRDWCIKNEVEQFIRDIGLVPNKKKTRWMDARSDDMVVTGVHVYETKGGIPRKFWRNIRSRLQHLAQEGKELDAETRGCLAYIKSVDSERYISLLQNFERRKSYGISTRKQCAGSQQVLSSSTSNSS